MTMAGVVALVLSLMSAVYGMQLASKTNEVHPRHGWSYFIRAPGKTRFRPIASANLIEAWNVCVKVKSIETAIFVDGLAYTYGQQNRSFTYYSIHMSEQDAEELLNPLIDAVCNQYTKGNWGNFVGLSFLNMSDYRPGTVRVSLYALASNLFQNSLIIDTINEALKREVKHTAIMDHHSGPLINAKHKSRMNTRAWAAYVEELNGSNRSGEFYRVDNIHGLKRLGRILSYSAVEERPFRMVIEQTDRSQSAAYQKLEIECIPVDAFEMVSLILVAASNTNKIFNISPSCGIERMIGFTLEPHGEKNALIALHFAENECIDLEAIKSFVKRLMVAERLNSVIQASSVDVPYVFPQRWWLVMAFNSRPLTNLVQDFPVEQFPQMANHHVVGNVEKAGFAMSFAPADLKPVQKGTVDFAVVMFIPSANIRLLLIRVWADLMRNKQFSQHRHIEKYTIQTLKDGGPYEFIAWLRTTKIRPEELKELRRIYAVFLRYIGIEGVNPMVAIIQNNDKKTLKPYLDDPIDLSMIDFDSIKHLEWSKVSAKVDPEAKSDWISPALKTIAKKNAPVQSKKKSKNGGTYRPRVAETENVEVSLQQAVEEAAATQSIRFKPTKKSFDTVKPVETVKPAESKKKPAQILNTKRAWTEVVVPQLKKEPVVVSAEEPEDKDDFPCVVPAEMEGCVHPKDLFKPAQVPNTVDARIASLGAGQYTPSALIQTNASPAPSSPPQGCLYTSSKLLWEGFTKGIRSSGSTDQEDNEDLPKIVVTLMDDDEHLAEHDEEALSETSESYDPFGSYEEEHSGEVSGELGEHSGEHSNELSDDHIETVITTESMEIDFTQILPLNDDWAMFYIKPPYTIKKLSTEPISTVQTFWQYMNHLPYPAIGHAYAFWRNDGSPETSNAENVGGGRLRTQIKLNNQWTKATGKDHWMHILVWLAANQEHRTIAKISGVVLKERIHGTYHIDVWYRKGFQYNDLQVFKRAMAAINEEQKLKFTGEWKIDRF